MGEHLVRCWLALDGWPSAVLCVLLSSLQSEILDAYLIIHLGLIHLLWLIVDVFNTILLSYSIYRARVTIKRQHRSEGSELDVADHDSYGSGYLCWMSWLGMSSSVSAKTVLCFIFFASSLVQSSGNFLGPNFLKTTISLSSLVFLLLLMTQHDTSASSKTYEYAKELTFTVVFDILDTVDILDVLLEEESRRILWDFLEEAILSIAVLNLILPTVPLYVLARTEFEGLHMNRHLVRMHKLLLALTVNVPMLLFRLILWHGHSLGVSPFLLKNIISTSMAFIDLFEDDLETYQARLQQDSAVSVAEEDHSEDVEVKQSTMSRRSDKWPYTSKTRVSGGSLRLSTSLS